MLASFLTFHFVSRPSSAGCHTIFFLPFILCFHISRILFFHKNIFAHTENYLRVFSPSFCLPFLRPFTYTLKKGQNLFQTTGNLRIFIVAKSLLFWFVELNAVVPALMMLCYFLLLVFFSCFRSLTLYTYTSSHLRMLNLTGSFFQ